MASSMAMEKAIDSTAKALASLAHKDSAPSKGFQTLIKLIGESKTKHVRNYFFFSQLTCTWCVYTSTNMYST